MELMLSLIFLHCFNLSQTNIMAPCACYFDVKGAGSEYGDIPMPTGRYHLSPVSTTAETMGQQNLPAQMVAKAKEDQPVKSCQHADKSQRMQPC